MKNLFITLLLISTTITTSYAYEVTDPLKNAGLVAPTCTASNPNIRPPKCVDYQHVFKKPPLCSAANPQVVPPTCSAIDEPNRQMTPGSVFAGPTLSDICGINYVDGVPLASTLPNEVKQQIYVNYSFPFKKTTGPCLGGGCALDNLIPIGLGGDNSLSNLWPQPATTTSWTAAMKDTLENTLRDKVCNLNFQGSQRVNFSSLTSGAAATNLDATVTPATSGTQVVSYVNFKSGEDSTGLAVETAATSGSQIVQFGVVKIGANATGLANSGTTYTASVSVDGAANAISVTGSTAQTFDTLITQINLDLTGAVAILYNGNIRITSSTTGASSTIAITDTDLFSTLTNYTAVNAAIPGVNATGTPYLASISVDGVANPISINGSTAQTFTNLVTQINADLTGAVASIVGGNILVTSDLTGVSSTIAITDTTLFNSTTDFNMVDAAINGSALLEVTYTASVDVDGVANPISLTGGSAQTFTTLVAQINADLSGAVASIDTVTKTILIKSNTIGQASTIAITPGTLFANPLANFVSVAPAIGYNDIIPLSLDLARTEIATDWKAAYTKYITNGQ